MVPVDALFVLVDGISEKLKDEFSDSRWTRAELPFVGKTFSDISLNRSEFARPAVAIKRMN